MSDHQLDKAREAIRAAALKRAPFEGFSVPMLRAAAKDAGYDRNTQLLAFPKGVMDLIDYHARALDAEMTARLGAMDLKAMRVRDRVTAAVRARLEAMEPFKEAERRAARTLSLPFHAASAATILARTVDAMWRGIGDTSTDFNYYTKRATLGAVYASTFLAWLGDRSEGHEETWAFLDRRIGNVMEFEKTKARVRKMAASLPSPLGLLRGLRYPGRARR